MRKLFIIPLSVACLTACTHEPEPAAVDPLSLKPRLVVMTDIGPANVEPDDNESAVRLLSYADRFEIEAICTTIGWNCDPYPAEWKEYLDRVIDAYETDVHNLMKRSGQTGFLPLDQEQGQQQLGYWPSAAYLRSRAMYGSERAGVAVLGDGNDSPGSDFLVKLANEDDPRPIWVTSWGGSNTLAQTFYRMQQKLSPEEFRAFVRKFRIYTITDQDMQWSMRMQRDYSSHQWMRRELQDDLLFIWDESAWLNQNELGKESWEEYVVNIQDHGEMGRVYPTFKWGVEGDTPSFLHLMPNGLNDPDDPTQVGWGGYHVYGLSPDSVTMAWTNWQEPEHTISDGYERRFYFDEFNDFAARMQWAAEGEGNHNPVVQLAAGPDSLVAAGYLPVVIEAEAGQTPYLDASQSFDPDGDPLIFHWWQQTSAGSYGRAVELAEAQTPCPVITIPDDAQGKSLHFVCEVHDDGPYRLVAYRRLIINVR